MKYRTWVLLVVMGLASAARADLLVGALNPQDYDVPSTVLKFDDAGNPIPSFNPGVLYESVENVAVSLAGGVYSIENSLGGCLLTQLDPVTGAGINGIQPTDSQGDMAELPTGLIVGPDGFIYVSSNTFTPVNDSIGVTNVFRVNPANLSQSSLYLKPATPFPASVGDLVFGPDSNLYFVDFGNQGTGNPTSTPAIWKYNTTTKKLSILVSNPAIPFGGGGIAFGPNGNLFVSGGDEGVQEYNPITGASISTFVPNGAGRLKGADDLAFGPDGSLYVSDGSEILRYSGTTGAFLDVALPTSDLADPAGGTWEITSFAVVPEPATIVPVIAGIALLLSRARVRAA